jgi:hypothetical protein
MSQDQYVACFPTDDQTHCFWVFDSRAEYLTKVLELLVRERLDAWNLAEEPPPELEARVLSFCETAAPVLESSGRWDAKAFLDALNAAFPLGVGVFPTTCDGLQWAGSAVEFVTTSDKLPTIFRETFEEERGIKAAPETLGQFLDYMLETWP